LRIYLTGFMGAGKTTVGRHLADLMGLPFVDLDCEIEARSGLSVREIFERHGEGEFRRLEHEALLEQARGPSVVVATGGGTIAQGASRETMRHSGVSVWLHPPFAVILGRIGARGKADRPLFQDEVQAWELYRQRLPAYEAADLRVEVHQRESAREVAARIVLLLPKERACAT
jgi:shikimate kinase